jgi:hypothetical protein
MDIKGWFKKISSGITKNQYNTDMARELMKTSDEDLAILKDAYPSNGYVNSELLRRQQSIRENK